MKQQETDFIEEFENKVKLDIEKHNLLSRNDKIIVACSGGKDSTTALYLMKKFGYDVEALIIDLLMGEWSRKNLQNIKKFCKDQNVKLHIISMRGEFGCSMCYLRFLIKSKTKLTSCGICGVVKKWLLNKNAREVGATKLCVGHNLDDEAQTVIMNLCNGNPEFLITLGPKSGGIADKKFVQRIKPLYFCFEKDIEKYSKLMEFPVLYDKCPCSTGTLRRFLKKWLNEMEKKEPEIKHNIINNFLKMRSAIPSLYENNGINYCKRCGEPSRNLVCKTCEMLKLLK